MKRLREAEQHNSTSLPITKKLTSSTLPSSIIPSISGVSPMVLAHSFQAPKARSTENKVTPQTHSVPIPSSTTLITSTAINLTSNSTITNKNSTNNNSDNRTTITSSTTASTTITQKAKAPLSNPKPPGNNQSNWAKLKAKVTRPDHVKNSLSSHPLSTDTSTITTIQNNINETNLSSNTKSISSSISEIKQSAIATIRGPFPVKPLSTEEQKYVALDCEMVGVGNDGLRSALALVVIVDYLGRVIYHKYVQPTEPVTDYRTFVSGVRPEHLVKAENFRVVQKEVSDIIRNKIVVGHGLINDMKALLLSHSRKHTRDTAMYHLFTFKGQGGKTRAKKLKLLVQQYLGIDIQTGEHEPAEDARAALALYKLHRRQWEHEEAGVTTDPRVNKHKGK